MPKVASLRGTTPAEIFQSGIENIEEIEAVAIAVQWKDGTITSGWSDVDPSLLALMVLALDERQRAALREAAAIPANSDRPPVNIRLSIPFLRWRFFIAVFGGAERRAPERLARDRTQNPLATLGNLLFVTGVVLAFYLVALIAIALSTSVLEY